MKGLSGMIIRKWAFYSVTFLSTVVLVSYQNCGKVKFAAPRKASVVTNSCGSVSMSPQNGIYENTPLTFTLNPPVGLTISNVDWDVTKNGTSVFTSSVNPMTHTFSGASEGPGDYIASASFMKSDGNPCELEQVFQVLSNDVCADPSGISGPTIGYVAEETTGFSVNFEDCFNGSVAWDMNNDGAVDINVPDGTTAHTDIKAPVGFVYNAPGVYTVRAVVTNQDGGAQITLTTQIEIRYKSCINPFTSAVVPHGQSVLFAKVNSTCGGQPCLTTSRQCQNGQFAGDATFILNPANCPSSLTCPPPPACTNGTNNPPTCTQCPNGQGMVNGQCTPNCTNGATNPPTCTQCPTNQTLVGGQCVNNCTNGATNPPTCNQCPANQTLVGGQCVNNCTNGATNPPTCNQCPSGQAMVNNQCTGITYTWNSDSWSSCSATTCGTAGTQTRTVTCRRSTDNAVVADSNCTTAKPATSQACSAVACQACALPWGGTVAHGGSVTAYQANSVACGQTCASEVRYCSNGVLSGTYASQACTTAACQCVNIPRQSTCFVAGTPITMADGTSKAIDQIKLGDKVLILDEETGVQKSSPVVELKHHEARSQTMYSFEFTNGRSFRVTGEHLIYTSEGYVPAMYLYQDFKDNKTVRVLDLGFNDVRIKNAVAKIDSVPTFNIHVEGISDDMAKYGRNGRGHNYYANGIVAHNLKWCCIPNCEDMDPTYENSCCTSQPPMRLPGTGVNCVSDRITTEVDDYCYQGDYQACSDAMGSPECTTTTTEPPPPPPPPSEPPPTTTGSFALSSCAFSLTSGSWSGTAGQPTTGVNSCEWAGSMYMGSSNLVEAIFMFGDYYDGQIWRLNNPAEWTITASGCTLNTVHDPKDFTKGMPNYCKSGSTKSYGGTTPLTWNATITAKNKNTGETRTLPITATFKPTLRSTP